MTDTIIVSAQVRTMEATSTSTSSSPGEDAGPTAVAIENGRITAVGSDSEVLELATDSTEIIDAHGGTLVPGLIDSHIHPVWGLELTRGIDLGGLDFAGVRAALAAGAQRLTDGDWLRGWNLDYKVFEHELRGDLFDDVLNGRAMVLLFYDLHTAVANAAALRAAGVTGQEEFDDNSLVVTDESGTPTGELREIPAYSLLLDAAPPLEHSDYVERVRTLLSELSRSGITSGVVTDGRDWHLGILDAIEATGGLPVRLHLAMWHRPGDDDARVEELISMLGTSGDRYRIQLIKMFMDGVIDTGTAWLQEPDVCGQGGRAFWNSVERYREVTRRYIEAGYQVTTHSCGDAGVAEILRTYRQCGTASLSGAPNRIEHLEVISDDDVTALAETGVVASMQPLHMQWREGDHSDSWATRLGPERVKRAFRIRDVLDAGGRVALGSDWPVAQHDARLGMAWTRLRRTPGVPEAPVFEPDQRLSGEEALLGYTRWAAEALGRTDLGVVAPGAVADLALFAEDPVTAEPDRLPELRVEWTIVGGELVYRR
jgi:predicted amidohydrolase YtcJ